MAETEFLLEDVYRTAAAEEKRVNRLSDLPT
jgi:hypothetical protein